MTIIDAHVHLSSSEFDTDAQAVIERAQSYGIMGALCVSVNSADAARVLELARLFPKFVGVALGVHPVQHHPETGVPRSVTPEETDAMMEVLGRHVDALVAVGEIGLDYSPWILSGEDYALKKRGLAAGAPNGAGSSVAAPAPDEAKAVAEKSKQSQLDAFRRQLAFAKEHSLPVNVHSRNAAKYVFEVCQQMQMQNVLLHSYDGSVTLAKKAAAAGYYFSIPPNILRSPHLQQVVAAVPLANLLIETDSPALSPLPKPTATGASCSCEGESSSPPEPSAVGIPVTNAGRNEPANAIVSCEEIARIKNVAVKEVVRVTYENTLTLFPKLRRLLV